MLLNGNISKTTTRIMMEQVWHLSETLKAFDVQQVKAPN